MENLQKVVAQMLKLNLDQQQKADERQQQLFLELHKQQMEQKITLQNAELQQKQLKELLVNALKGSNSEKDTIFS